jgi:hypothetical protein
MVPRGPASLLRAAVVAAMLCAASAGAAGFVWIDSDPGDWVGGGEARRLPQMPPADHLDVSGGPSWLWIDVWGSDELQVMLRGPDDAPLVPGVYAHTSRFGGPSQAGLDVGLNGRGCNESSGRLVVHEIAFDELGMVAAFAADLEQHCDGASAALRVAVRWNAGDAACASAAPGAACDDGDACTAGDACDAGHCVGTPGTCGDDGECDPQVCAPLTGACMAVRGTRACDDGDPCTERSHCDAATCVGGTPVYCGPVCMGFQCEPGTGQCIRGAPPVCDDGDPATGWRRASRRRAASPARRSTATTGIPAPTTPAPSTAASTSPSRAAGTWRAARASASSRGRPAPTSVRPGSRWTARSS